MIKSCMATKSGLTVIQANNVDPEIRNLFKSLCARKGITLKEGLLQVVRAAIDADTLELTAKS